MAAKTKPPKNIDLDLDDDEDIIDINSKPDKKGKAKKEKAEKTPKEKKPPKEKKAKGEKSGGGKIVPILLAFFIIGGISAAIFFNVLNVRTNFVLPLLEKVPLVNNLIKTPAEGAEPAKTNEQLLAELAAKQAEIDQLTADYKTLNERKDSYVAEVTRLEPFEKQKLAVDNDKKNFDTMIALKDPAAYSKFYNSINVANQQDLANQAAEIAATDKNFKKYMATVQAVDSADAAKILSELVKSDMDLVVLIMENLDSETAGQILGAMDAKVSATIVKRMVPPEKLTP